MHRIEGYDIELTQADTLRLKFTFDGDTLPEGTTLKFCVKKVADDDAPSEIEKIVSVVDNVASVTILPQDTLDLAIRTYYWDARLLIPDENEDEVNTPMEYATFSLLPAVSKLPDEQDFDTLRTLIAKVNEAIARCNLQLRSPDNTLWQITVGNDGVLDTEEVEE